MNSEKVGDLVAQTTTRAPKAGNAGTAGPAAPQQPPSPDLGWRMWQIFLKKSPSQTLLSILTLWKRPVGFVIREQFSNVYKTSNIYTEILLGGLAVAFRMSHDLNVCFSQNVNLVPYFMCVCVCACVVGMLKIILLANFECTTWYY